MASSARKDVLKYWRGVMKDTRQPQRRRDDAAKQVLKLITIAAREKRRIANEEKKTIWKEILSRGNPKGIKKDLLGSTDKNRGAPGKKDLKKVAAEETATNSEWSDLIPSAQVIPLRQRKAK